MKICDKCGTPNYKIIKDGKKNRVCEQCNKVMSSYGDCNPSQLTGCDGVTIKAPIDYDFSREYN